MTARRGWRALKFVAIAIVAAALLGTIVMALWNMLIPPLFGLHRLNVWQALGLLVLSRVLFGRFGRPSGHWGFGRRPMLHRWAHLSAQEREQLRSGWGRCGSAPSGGPAPDTAAASPRL